MMKDLVSVVMPSYNTAAYIAESINSVINQTYNNWELLIVDDCSNDDTDKIVATFKDSRIRYIKNENNMGAAESRNRAIREAKGRWIAFLDSDDLWKPQKLEAQVHFMKEHNYAFSYTCYQEIDEKSQRTGITVSGPRVISKYGMYMYCWPGCLTVMYDAMKVGVIQISDIKKNNDYAMWLKVIKKSKCYLLSEQLAFYRKRKGSISNLSIWKLIKWHYKLFREADDRGAIVSAFYTIQNLFFGAYKKVIYVKSETYRWGKG